MTIPDDVHADISDRGDGCFLVTLVGDRDEPDIRRHLDHVDQMLAAGGPFGLIFSYPQGKPRQTKAAHRLETSWMRANRAKFAGTCVGIAFVHSGSKLEQTLRRIALTGVGRRFFGCPCGLHTDVASAETWVNELLTRRRAPSDSNPRR